MRPLLVNGRFRFQRMTGVQRYALEVTRRLSGSYELLQPPTGLAYLSNAWEQTVLATRSPRAVLWSPCSSGPVTRRRQVVTVHDLTPLNHPEWFSSRFAAWHRFALPRLMRRSELVITVATFMADEIRDRFVDDTTRVVAIPNGVGPDFRPASDAAVRRVLRRCGVSTPRYLLVVSSLEPRKNLSRLVDAWRRICRSFPDVSLVVIGDADSRVHAETTIRDAPQLLMVGRRSDDELVSLLTGAECLCYVSEYEGFGLPPLEALSCGTRCLVSDLPVLRETCAGVATFVDPLSISSIAEGIEALLLGDSADGTAERRARAATFTWERTARFTEDALNCVRRGDFKD